MPNNERLSACPVLEACVQFVIARRLWPYVVMLPPPGDDVA